MSSPFVSLRGLILAIRWGSYQNHIRIGIDWWTSPAVNQSTTSVTLRMDVWAQTDSSSSISGNWPLSVSGWFAFSGSVPANMGPGSVVLLRSFTDSVTLTSSTMSPFFNATLNHFFGSSNHSATGTVPARFARTPTGLTVARISDGSQRLDWTRESTYTAVVVQRRVNGGSWSQVGRPTGNAATYTDNTTSANNKYEYRVAGVSAGGQSGWSNIATVYTTPAAPTGVVAARVSNTEIVVSAGAVPPHATAFDVEDDGVVVASGVSLPWTHLNPSLSTVHEYRVRGVVGALTGAWSVKSNAVQLLAAPLAPTELTPNGGVAASDADVRLSWRHNPVDTTTQTEYELRYRVPSGAWTTVTGTTESFRDIALPVGVYEWQVRTKGQYATFSDWSAVATATVIDRPGVAILSPVDDVGISFATVVWSWFQAQGRPQSAWRVELVRDGVIVEVGAGSGAATSHTFATALVDGGTYTIRGQAATGDVWSEWTVEQFTTVFPPPAAPVVAAGWDESAGQHSIHVEPGELASFAWLGGVNGSASTMTIGESVTTNLVPNPLMSGSVTGWVSEGAAPVWDAGLSVSLLPGEGVYVDVVGTAGPVMSARVDVNAATAYRVALFDPTGTSVAHWSDTYTGVNTVLMEALEFTAGRPLRLYVSLDAGGPLRLSNAVVVAGPVVSRPFDGDSQDDVATEYMTVERSIDGDVWEMVHANLVGENAIQDGEGLSNGSTWYRVTAFSSMPSAAVTVVEVVADSGSLWLSGDTGFGVTARLPYNPVVAFSQGRSRTVKRYMGRPLGVPYSGGQLSRVIDVSGMLRDGDTDVIAVDAFGVLAQVRAPIFMFRDPDGRRIYGVATGLSMARQQVGVWGYSFQFEETSK